MSELYKILIVEDMPADVLLAEIEIKKHFDAYKIVAVDNQDDYLEKLVSFNPDVIISDYTMPQFNGLFVLKKALEIVPDTPVIIFTGLMNEDIAIECMRAGAADYVIKEHLKRLGLSVIRSIEQRKTKLERHQAIRTLESREETYRKMFMENPQPMLIYDSHNLAFLEVNHATEKLYGYTAEEFLEMTIKDIRPKEDIQKLLGVVGKPRENYYPSTEWRHLKKNGELIYVEITSHGIIYKDRQARHVLVNNITQQKKAEEELIYNENKYRAFFENSNDAILLTDPINGMIYEANPSACQLFGYSREEFLKLNRSLLVDINDPDLPNMVNQRKVSGKVRGELSFIRKDGSVFRGEITSAIFEDVNKNQRSSMIIRDMTERIIYEEILKTSEKSLMSDLEEKKQLIEELTAAKIKAEESDRLKMAFLHNISHEIRTPLNAIVGFSSIIGNSDLAKEKRQKFMEVIQASSDQLLSVISGIISLAYLEAGQEVIQAEASNLNDMVKTVYDRFQSSLHSERLHIHYDNYFPTDKAHTICDSAKITQVLLNLVGNAIKFTPSGTVNFGYRLKNGRIEFFVADTGIGIPAEMQGLIFERFRQIENSVSRKYGGLGLGLALSKGYVELMGGHIRVESEPGKGSIFTFDIPYQPVQNEAISTEQPSNQHLELAGNKRILIAEDEDFNYELVHELIAEPGLQLVRAYNGEEAVNLCIGNSKPDLILMDIKMPVMDGSEATQKIKSLLPDIPIVAITAYALKEEKKRLLQAGFDDYVKKPFDKDVLIQIINKYLKDRT